MTVYQNNIPPEVVSLQAEVINRFLPPGCEFEPREVGHHALGLDEYFRELRHEAYLVLDIDSIPLAEWVIPWFLENALAGILVGAAQRANQFANGEHIYAGPGAVAFSRDIFEQLGHLSFKATDHGDVGEELTFEAERLGIPVSLLWPTHVFTDKWPLRGGRRFGHGTTYGGAVFHAYEISKGHTVPMFLAKCREVLGRRVDDHQFALLADATSGEFKSPQRPDEPQARFHEEWYPEPELAPLAALAKSIKGKPGLVLEIGCWEGRSTSTIANACYPETLTAVDTWQGNVSEDSQHVSVRLARERDVFGTCRDNLRVLTRGNVILQRVDAFSFLQRCDQPIRFCHLDAANDYPFVREAISLLLPRLAVGGILCGHNFEIAHAGRGDLQGGIERAVRELLPGFTRTGSVWSYVRPGS